MSVIQPGMKKYPDTHEISGQVEGMHPQRVRTNLILFSDDNRNDVNQQSKDDGQTDGNPGANPTVGPDGQMVDEILRGNVALRISVDKSLYDIHDTVVLVSDNSMRVEYKYTTNRAEVQDQIRNPVQG